MNKKDDSHLNIESRLLGHYHCQEDGPCIVCVGGMHGNEPSGIIALKRVLKKLNELKPAQFKGDLVALAGNITALNKQQRCIDEDFNRIWTEARIDNIHNNTIEIDTVENREHKELIAAMDDAFKKARGKVYFLDLHTTSAQSAPFTILGDTLHNREFALTFPIPALLGLEELLDGTITEYVTELGYTSLGFEAGQHDDLISIDRHEALIWLSMLYAGCIIQPDVPDTYKSFYLLNNVTRNLPNVMQVDYRHGIVPTDEFRIAQQFDNFDTVQEGDILAYSSNGTVHSPQSGRIILPLKQTIGSDGFFIGRDIHMKWLIMSKFLRRIKAGRLIHLLPGVKRHPEDKDTLIIDSHVARWYINEIFHLLGFRIKRQEGETIVVRRRRPDRI